eukprot:6206429-Pleurochrysis_carterae.AAC.1
MMRATFGPAGALAWLVHCIIIDDTECHWLRSTWQCFSCSMSLWKAEMRRALNGCETATAGEA